MTSADSTAERTLLLGVAGFERASWAASYFPQDLPSDWRLAYLANDCDCLFLPPESWCDIGDAAATAWTEALGEAPEAFRLFLQVPAGGLPSATCLEPFAAGRPVLLAQHPVVPPVDWPVWRADGAHQWVDGGGRRLVRWQVGEVDLRDWRSRAENLESGVRAIVLDGPAGSPALLHDLRVMLQIMGIA